jgi:hypothetical protein
MFHATRVFRLQGFNRMWQFQILYGIYLFISYLSMYTGTPASSHSFQVVEQFVYYLYILAKVFNIIFNSSLIDF